MRTRIGWSLALLAGWGAARAAAGELNVGDAAPKIEVKGFVKGDPVGDLEKGKVYVVEFWATWCGPCRATIPHLTELQKKYPGVTFVGVSVWENDQAAVKPFVKEMAEKMGYRVALDVIPEGGTRMDGKMAKGWMEAAAQEGIPAAFLVDAHTRVAWVGDPTKLEGPLQEVVNGTWDLRAAADQFRKEHAPVRKVMALRPQLDRARKSGDPRELVKILDDAIAEDTSLERALGTQKFLALARQADAQEKATDYGRHLVEEVLKDNAQALNQFAWNLVAPGGKLEGKFVTLALQAAQRADELAQGKNAAITDTLAKAYFDGGDTGKALEAQERAAGLAKGTPLEKEVTDRLEKYRKAVKK
jgi:thiol-disulfide isomerase/thioredoxin